MIIKPDWPAPNFIHAFSTTRLGGVSPAPFDSLNLGYDVGDEVDHVLQNRNILKTKYQLPNEPKWIKQVHGDKIIEAEKITPFSEADASFTQHRHNICVVLTADCLPVLLTDTQGSFVAAIHAGWRGLAKNIITKTLKRLNAPSDTLLAWLGPAIGPKSYQVGPEVREHFLDCDFAFTPDKNDRFMCDLYAIARFELEKNGIKAIYGGQFCTFGADKIFFSYRRAGNTGRMATLIWIE